MTSYIGIDVSKKSLHLYLPVHDQSFEVPNNPQGFARLLSCFAKHYEDLSSLIAVFEPTGGYERGLREFLEANAINFALCHPNKVRAYAKAKGWLAKTDVIDAKLLADYAHVFSLSPQQEYLSKGQEHLQALIQRREQLISFKNQETNRLETQDDSIIIKLIQSHLKELDKQLSDINELIKKLCADDPLIKNKVDILTSIPGVGMTLATTVICQAPQLGYIDFRQLTALVGLAPYARESGRYKGKRSIFAGRAKLRKVLYMAAVASLRCNEKLKKFYDRLIANHKPTKVALVAVMRKMLSFMHALVKNHSLWNANILS